MLRLSRDVGDPEIRAALEKTMSGNSDSANSAPLYAARDVRHGAVPCDLAEWRERLLNFGHAAVRFERQSRRQRIALRQVRAALERSGYLISPHTDQLRPPLDHRSNSTRAATVMCRPMLRSTRRSAPRFMGVRYSRTKQLLPVSGATHASSSHRAGCPSHSAKT